MIKSRYIVFIMIYLLTGCSGEHNLKPSQLLGNSEYPAICYGGFRDSNRQSEPSVEEIKEDLLVLHEVGFRIVRTYHAYQYQHAQNVLRAIKLLQQEDSSFEMYVMLGVWIQCENAWTDKPIHNNEDLENNTNEINAAIELANKYPEIIKVIAVGNESMIHWASGYYVKPNIILKWVKHLQNLKRSDEINEDIWITSSDNFASWGGGEKSYQTNDLLKLMRAVDYVSIHSYPFHDTHYNSSFWILPNNLDTLNKEAQIEYAIDAAINRIADQYNAVSAFLSIHNIDKQIHIGETGWATISNNLYGETGSKAADEYKQFLYYNKIKAWADSNNISCFFFEAFDEPWKDTSHPDGSENHFGLFNKVGNAKLSISSSIEPHNPLTGRNGLIIQFSNETDSLSLFKSSLPPPLKKDMPVRVINMPDTALKNYDPNTSKLWVIFNSNSPDLDHNNSYPNYDLKLHAWEGTCELTFTDDEVLLINTGQGDWWGGSVDLTNPNRELDLSEYREGYFNFSIRGASRSAFEIGFLTGHYDQGTQQSHFIAIGDSEKLNLTPKWVDFKIPLDVLLKSSDPGLLCHMSSPLYVKGIESFDGKEIELRSVFFSID